MAEPAKDGKGPQKPQRNPFSEPLDANQLQSFFRRLLARPHEEQRAFVSRINWNLLDAGAEYHMMSWVLANLQSSDVARQTYALELLNKLPHFKRAKYAPRFQAVLPTLDADLAHRVADAFGPVLGGAPKRSNKPPAKPAKQEAPKPADEADLSKLKDFFGKFGGAR